MASPTELLQQIDDKLERLPERIAAAIGTSPASGTDPTTGKDAAGTDANKGKKGKPKKSPGILDQIEDFTSSVGYFAPRVGQISSGIKAGREVASSFGRLYSSVTGKGKEDDKPTVRPPAPKPFDVSLLAQASQLTKSPQTAMPSVVGRQTTLAGPANPTMLAQSGGQQKSDTDRELISTLRELIDKVSELNGSMDQADPDPSRDAERSAGARQSMWQMASGGEKNEGGGSEDKLSKKAATILRPSQNVPSGGKKEESGIPWGTILEGVAGAAFGGS